MDQDDQARLIRIERKINEFGDMLCGAIALGAGFAAYHLVAVDLSLGWLLGDIAAVVAFGLVGVWARRGFYGGR